MFERNQPEDRRTCDLLAAYEMGLLDPGERLRFESHLADCDDCLQDLYAMAPAAVAVQEDPARFARTAAAALGRNRPSLLASVVSALRACLRPRILVPVALAAVFTVVILGPDLRDGPGLAGLAEVEPLPYSRIAVRAGADRAEQLIHQGMEGYLRRNYAEAADRLAEALTILREDPEAAARMTAGLPDQARLFLGVSLLLEGRSAAAVTPLAAAAASPLAPLADRANWYLAQAYLLTGKKEAALQTLSFLTDSPVYQGRAEAQIAAIGRNSVE